MAQVSNVVSSGVCPVGGLSVAVRRAIAFADGICGRTVIVADGSNMLHGGRGRDFRIDYGAVLQCLSGDVRVMAKYIGTRASYHRPSQDSYFRCLCRLGWDVHKFDLLVESGWVSEDELAVDGDVRAEVRKAANRGDVDSIVLLSGDGGMTNAVHYAREQSKDVFVVAWDRTLNPALAEAATDFALIDDMRPLIALFH